MDAAHAQRNDHTGAGDSSDDETQVNEMKAKFHQLLANFEEGTRPDHLTLKEQVLQNQHHLLMAQGTTGSANLNSQGGTAYFASQGPSNNNNSRPPISTNEDVISDFKSKNLEQNLKQIFRGGTNQQEEEGVQE